MKHLRPTLSRRNFLAGSVTAAAALPALRAATASPTRSTLPGATTMHFAQPASKWPNALPVGNGRLGAMVFGIPGLERIQLNEESIWNGEPNRDRDNPRAKAAIPRIRELLFQGDSASIAEAEKLATDDVLSIPRRMPMYETLGDLHLDFTAMGIPPDHATVSANSAEPGIVPPGVTDYRLELDLDTAICTTTFRHNGNTVTREVFASAPDQVIIVRLTPSKPRSLSFRATLDRPASFQVSSPGGGRLVMTGQALPVNDNPNLPDKEPQTGVRFHSELRILLTGYDSGVALPGRAPAVVDGALEVRDADAVTLLFDCATSYRYPAHTGKSTGLDAALVTGDPQSMAAAVHQNLDAAARRSYDELKQRHIADHQRFFRRVSFNLGADTNLDKPTDQRVNAMKAGGEDPHLFPLFFQFGRYLLISSSRPGTLAANLQGIWNESVDPPWGSKYTVNINAQMNYWFAEGANLSDCHLPLFDLLSATRRQGTRTAQQLYGARGSVVHHNTDIWGDAGPIDGLGGGIWAMGAIWLSLHLWTHFEFTGDRRFLAEHAYPAFRENAVFLLDYLVKDPHTGHLTSGPSCSPENSYELPDGRHFNLCMGPTMDITFVRALFWRLLQAAALLPELAAKDGDLLDHVRSAYGQLPPFQIAPDGRLQEWPQNYKDREPGHRHLSHLAGLFPENQITPQATPELARAAREVIDRRLAAGGGSTGWSRSWIVNLMARLGDGDACYFNLRELFRQSVRPNLFDVCGLKENSPFQIDGNLGTPSGMLEMLVQSHAVTPLTLPATLPTSEPITLRLLPALPKAWPSGSFKGLRARGGLELDLTWSNGRATRCELRASNDVTLILALPKGQSLQHTSPAQALEAHDQHDVQAGSARLKLKAGERCELTFA